MWRAEGGAVIEALGFSGAPPGQAARNWLAPLGPVLEEALGLKQDSVLAWAGTRSFDAIEIGRFSQVARFAAAPIATIGAKAALGALLEAYLGRRSAARVQGGDLKRGAGETIRAALLYADLRGFTQLSESSSPPRSSRHWMPGSTASQDPSMPSAARC